MRMNRVYFGSSNRLHHLAYFIFLLIVLSGCGGKVNEEKLEESRESIENILENDKEIVPYIKDIKWEYLSNEFTYKNGIKFLEHGYYYYRLTINTDNFPYKQQGEKKPLLSNSLHIDIHEALRTSKFFKRAYGEESEDYVVECGWSTTCNVELIIEDSASNPS